MKQTPPKPKKLVKYLFLAVVEAVVLFFPALILILVFGGLVGVALGFNAFGNLNDYQNAQILFWTLPALAAVCYWAQRRLRDQKSDVSMVARWLLIVSVPLLALGGFISSIAVANHANKATSCDLSNTLDAAVYATYPIATDHESGSAFAVDSEGTLVTAYHVIAGAQAVYMNTTDGREQLTVVRTDPVDDLALLKYSKPTPRFIGLNSNPRLGEDVYALGYPGNTFSAGKSSITKGIVSRIIDNSDVKAIDASAPDELSFIQTDAAINPGNSGGPLIDKCGVVGVVDAISDSEDLHQYGLGVSEQNISYAISTSTFKTSLGL